MTPPPPQWSDVSGQIYRINLCPNVMLGAVILTALTFIAHLGRNGVLVFLLAGLLLLVRKLNLTFRNLLEYGWLFLLPMWCILSALWSDHPDLSLRHGTQLLFTFMVAMVMASRLAPTAYLRLQFAALFLAGLASLLIGDTRPDGVWIGIFNSKNSYAFTMVALLLCSAALLASRNETSAWRLVGVIGALLAVPQIAMAESVGAIMTSTLVLFAGFALLQTSALPSARQTMRLLGQSSLLLVLILVALYLQDAVLNYVFTATGKDPSLTGRTELWDSALREIGRAPLLGTGYRAFWVEGNALAEALWAEFYIASKSGFNFHNLYLSNAVEIGIIGVVLQLILLLPALILNMRWLLKTGHAPAMFSFMVVAFVIGLSFVEVPVFFEFHSLSVMVLVALVYGVRALREAPDKQAQVQHRQRPLYLPRHLRASA
jgi:exopolysaccharide production protein ExoQ